MFRMNCKMQTNHAFSMDTAQLYPFQCTILCSQHFLCKSPCLAPACHQTRIALKLGFLLFATVGFSMWFQTTGVTDCSGQAGENKKLALETASVIRRIFLRCLDVQHVHAVLNIWTLMQKHWALKGLKLYITWWKQCKDGVKTCAENKLGFGHQAKA